jgi:hypothetical protein
MCWQQMLTHEFAAAGQQIGLLHVAHPDSGLLV